MKKPAFLDEKSGLAHVAKTKAAERPFRTTGRADTTRYRTWSVSWNFTTLTFFTEA